MARRKKHQPSHPQNDGPVSSTFSVRLDEDIRHDFELEIERFNAEKDHPPSKPATMIRWLILRWIEERRRPAA